MVKYFLSRYRPFPKIGSYSKKAKEGLFFFIIIIIPFIFLGYKGIKFAKSKYQLFLAFIA